MKRNQEIEKMLARMSFLEKEINLLTTKIQYTEMNQYQYEDCIDDRKQYLKEHRQLQEELKSRGLSVENGKNNESM